MTANRKDKPPYQTPILTKLDELNSVTGGDIDLDDFEFDCVTGSSANNGCKDGGVAGGFGCDQGTDATSSIEICWFGSNTIFSD